MDGCKPARVVVDGSYDLLGFGAARRGASADLRLMERGSSSEDALPAACQLITQCSLGREDSSASLSKLEQDSLRFGMEGWHKFATNIQSEKAAQKYLMEAAAGDSSRQILEFSNTMQTVSNSLRKVAESNVHLQLEAAEWRRKYEHLLQQRNGEYDSIANLKEGGKFIAKARHDSEEENGYCNSPSSPEGRTGNLSQKASFRLLWGCNGEKPRRHKHDIVSYDCGNISTVTSSNKQITLVWDSTPQAVCIFTRPNSIPVQQVCKQMIRWLRTERDMSVFVEPRVKDKLLEDNADFSFVQTWESDEEILFLHKKVDLVITLGGDGTVLWAASLFKGPVPPFISFSMGSLGFMTAFQSERYQECLEYVMKGPVYITLRHRLQCQIIRETGESNEKANSEVYLVLNEVSIDRGMSSSLTNLECYCDNEFVTSVQGDGLILSTTSGSTAYSLAAGGSMVHPHVPAILFTPICPHSLSFRPLILPGYVTLKVQVPIQSSGHAWASFDGKDRVQLCAGDALICHVALWPVPTASIEEPTHHFLCSVRERLHWNLRKNQN